MAEQLVDFKHEVRRVYAAYGKDASDPEDNTPVPAPKPAPVPPEPKKADSETEIFFNEWTRLRSWLRERSAQGTEVDSLDSMRPIKEGRRGLAVGISARQLISAMTLHWSAESRQAAQVQNVDTFSESTPLAGGMHRMTGYVAKLVEAHIPIMLIGAAGTGKSTAIRQVAKHLEMAYGETPLTAGATPSWLLGSNTVQGYRLSHFLEIYSGGGIFNFEEIDAADPNMLIVVNNALALDPGEDFFNPVNGEKYTRHADFIPAATANTFGLGANRNYTGRERLDFATIDRFRMGRVIMPLDEEFARSLMFDN